MAGGATAQMCRDTRETTCAIVLRELRLSVPIE
jgi:hypothetical protein